MHMVEVTVPISAPAKKYVPLSGLRRDCSTLLSTTLPVLSADCGI